MAQIHRVLLSSSLSHFTTKMFQYMNKTPYIMGEHHKVICDALDHVMHGDPNYRRLIINIGPRYGKCVAPDTRIMTKRGLIDACEVKAGDDVYSFEDGKAVLAKCAATGVAHKGAVKITMRSGRGFVCSDDHPMLTTFGYKSAGELQTGDRIQAIRASIDNDYEINDDELIFITLMIFEGCCNTAIGFSNTDKVIIDLMRQTCENLGFELRQPKSKAYCDYSVTCHRTDGVKRMLEKYGILGHLSYDKRLPRDWFALSKRQKLLFIDLMFATDGYALGNGQSGITLANKGLVEDIQQMLSTLGIISSINEKRNKKRGAWVLTIPRGDTVKLLNMITFYHKRFMSERSLNKKAVCITDTFPYEIISKERLTYKVLFSPYRCSCSKDITREKFVRLSEKFESLKKYICEDFYLDKVLSVESVGEMDLIDIEVEGTHNFIGNGLVSHNTLLVSQMFIAMGLAVNPLSKTIHLSYSGQLTMDNSMAVKDIVNCEYFQHVFDTRIKYGSDTKSKWSTEQGGGLYATSTLGQITGFGAGLVDEEETEEEQERNIDEYAATFNPGHFNGAIVIDDPIRPEDALSDVVREKVNRRFETTIRNRVNSRNTPIIIIMQRLHEHDLCGYLMETEPDKWKVISLPVLYTDDNGEEQALWPFKHTVEELHQLRDINPFVFETQYMQNPKPLEGLMYSQGFRTYSTIPASRHHIIKAYCDSADTGADFLCDIIYVETETANYVLDVLYTQKPMEYTEPKTAERYTKYKVQRAIIESNNGGRGFARNVEAQCRMMGNNTTRFTWFTQTLNKQVRIFTHSAEVQNLTYFPEGWERLWPEFNTAIMGYLKEGRNAHDDACLVAGTKVATIFGDKPIEKIKSGDYVLTPFGVRRVVASGCTGEKKVIDHLGLTATADHKVYNDGLFIELENCNKDWVSKYSLKEQIRWRYKRLLCSKELSTSSWGRGGIILASRKVMQGDAVLKDFMSQFGKMLTERQYLKAAAFIIKMATLLTTTSAIWSVYRFANICRTIQDRICKMLSIGKRTDKYSTKQERKPANGTGAKRAEHGTANTPRARSACTRILSARIVESISNLFSKTPCFAATTAENNTDQRNLNMSECASSAARSFTMESAMPVQGKEYFAHVHAAQYTATYTASVYNIKVEKDGCFYANGILVSNCDALTGTVEHRDMSSKENEAALRNLIRRQ